MRGDRILESITRPIDWMMTDPLVTDIVVNRPYRVAVRKSGIWSWHDVPSFDADTLDAATILIGQRSGREFDEQHPYVNSTMPGGQRFQGVRPPGTKPEGVLWAIRRPPTKARTMDDDDFEGLFDEANLGQEKTRAVQQEVIDHFKAREWRALCRSARMAGMSIAFCGPTGGGKSDMERRLIQVGRPNIRMVTIETDDEYGDAGPENKAALFYDESQISSDEAVRIALRLVPVEIFLQEVRGAEAYSLLRALESGHSGCTSWHADEGREFEALSIMVRMHTAGREMPEATLNSMMRSAFDIIFYCKFDGVRFKVTSVRMMAEEAEKAR
jgi:type IV secretion system protein VirB11